MDALTLTLVAAAILAPLDLVRNSHALERVRAQDRTILRLLLVLAFGLAVLDPMAGLVVMQGM